MAFNIPSRANGDVLGPVGNSVTFAFTTDWHHDPALAASDEKYYQDSLDKMNALASALNARSDISFVFGNGDLIDGSADASTAQTDLADIVSAFNTINAPGYLICGNHDLVRLTKAQAHAITGQPAGYYSFAFGGVTFIALDGNYTADDDEADLSVSEGVASPFTSYIPPTQRTWLADTIASSPFPCVVLCHYPVYYSGFFSWGLTNGAAVRTILEAAGTKVIACISGHLHDNYIRSVNGILYVSLQALVTNAYPSLNYSIVSVYPKTRAIKVVASGVQMSQIAA